MDTNDIRVKLNQAVKLLEDVFNALDDADHPIDAVEVARKTGHSIGTTAKALDVSRKELESLAVNANMVAGSLRRLNRYGS